MKANEFQKKLPNLSILDIRTQRECEDFNVGGIHIPLDYLLERVIELDSSTNYVVICYNGTQSFIATRLLKAKGYHAENLEGGLEAYLSL